eukprot:EG_transcript_8863
MDGREGLLERVESSVFRRVRGLNFGLEGVRLNVLAEGRVPNTDGATHRWEGGRGRGSLREGSRPPSTGLDDRHDPDTAIPITFLDEAADQTEDPIPTAQPDPPARNRTALATLRLVGASFPLLCIPALTVLYDHWAGILSIVTVFVLLVAIDAKIEAQTALKDSRSPAHLLALVLALLLLAAAPPAAFPGHRLWSALLLCPAVPGPPPPPSPGDTPKDVAAVAADFLTAAWLVVITGFMGKALIMTAKATLLIAAGRLQPSRKGHLLAAIEGAGTVYLHGVPLAVWTRFFFQGHYPFCLAAVNAALYFYYKGRQILHHSKMTWRVISACTSARPLYGVYADEAEVTENGEPSECSICREPMAPAAVKLACDHIFCEDCIVSWLDRKKQCPLCRHTVEAPDQPHVTLRSDGSTNVWFWWF